MAPRNGFAPLPPEFEDVASEDEVVDAPGKGREQAVQIGDAFGFVGSRSQMEVGEEQDLPGGFAFRHQGCDPRRGPETGIFHAGKDNPKNRAGVDRHASRPRTAWRGGEYFSRRAADDGATRPAVGKLPWKGVGA